MPAPSSARASRRDGAGLVCCVLLLLLFLGLVDGFVVPAGPMRSSLRMQAAAIGSDAAPPQPKRVLVVGGTGRVGGSTVRALRAWSPSQGKASSPLPPLAISVGGRSPENFERAKERWMALDQLQRAAGEEETYVDVGFVALDHEDPAALKEALAAARPDVIIHTAGPFQRRTAPEVLKAALALKCPYVDVCDDIDLSQIAKGFHEEARAAGVPMLISTGVWPGISSLMAVDVAEALGGAANTEAIDFQFFTAGSGGAGTTILSATFLILSEAVLAFVDGQARRFPPASDFQSVDFGPGVGPRQIFRLNLLEAYSCFRTLGIPNCSTKFGTAPDGWNYLLKGMTLLPKWVLRDRAMMQALARVSEPVVRIVDQLVGSTNAMRVVGRAKDDGREAVALYAHEDLETCVGVAIAAFAAQVLHGRVAPGVYYPEEAFAGREARDALFELGTEGAFTWIRPEALPPKPVGEEPPAAVAPASSLRP